MVRISRRNLLLSGLTLSASSLAARLGWGRAAAARATQGHLVLLEAEGFASLGGWVIDQEFVDQMGSSFLLAHGMGTPVEDARTEAVVPEAGVYRVWVRTRDWVAEWKAPGAPGRFKVEINGKTLKATFGTEGVRWHWQDGGTTELPAGKVEVALHDLTGFEGRCDAILFASDRSFRPPDDGPELAALRRKALNLPAVPEDAGQFDLVVAGGGIAGITTSISAARLGLKVALIGDRPVLGGNASSEVRVSIDGNINLPPYPAVGVVVGELEPYHGDRKNHCSGDKAMDVVRAEKNIQLFLNTHVFAVEKQGNKISAVVARNVATSRELRFQAPLFADCTGDADVGYLAGADYHYGRESRSETGELLAPDAADHLVMGMTIQWFSEDAGKAVPFPETPWALAFNEQTVQNATQSNWDWEVTGLRWNQIDEFETVRDHALRAIYGNWSYQKNHSADKAKYENLRLRWVGYIGGKRESRRLLGDVVLDQQNIENQHVYPDAAVPSTWPIDLHYPEEKNAAEFPGEEFRTVAHFGAKSPYAVPYRCFYSRNIDNLFMAGRDISVTHVALGTTRVQRTTGMMGEVVGMAAAIARRHDTSPRGVYQNYLPELKEAMTRGVGKSALAPPPKSAVLPGYALAWSDEFDGSSLDMSKWDFRTDTKHGSTQLPQNISLRDGNLIITVNSAAATTGIKHTAGGAEYVSDPSHPEPPAGIKYSGGGVISKDAFGYGYYECRMRIMAGKGWHSSFWMMKHDGSGSTATPAADIELDVIEQESIDLLSYDINLNQWRDEHRSIMHKRVPTQPLSDYHVYGCEYTPTTVKYFFDGALVETADISSLPQGNVNIWLTSIASSLKDADRVDDSRLPGHVDYDYVRFYRKS
jgi:hypothetical protein